MQGARDPEGPVDHEKAKKDARVCSCYEYLDSHRYPGCCKNVVLYLRKSMLTVIVNIITITIMIFCLDET